MGEKQRKIGKFLYPHGLKGELYLHIFSGDYSWFNELTEVELETKSAKKQKFQIKSTRPHKEGLLVTLVGVETRNQSDELSGSMLWVSEDFFATDETDEELFLVEIEAFQVYDGDLLIGKIVGFSFNGAHDLLLLRGQDSFEFDVPFVEEFIVDIDYEEQKVFMQLPEGLIESQRDSQKNSKESRDSDS